jgi:hypothetical protein
MIKLTPYQPNESENRSVWIAAWHVLYVRTNIYGGTFVRMLDGAHHNVTEKAEEVALLVASRGRP